MSDKPRLLEEDELNRGLALAKGSLYRGEPLESYGREELLAIAALGWKAYSDSLQKRLRDQLWD